MRATALFTLLLMVSRNTVLGKPTAGNCQVQRGNECVCCSTGYGGVNCGVECSNCVTYHEKTDGMTDECINECIPGFFGDECNIQCPEHCAPGNNGVNICKKEDGICMNECRSGFHGKRCENICGSNCNNGICFQKDGTCNGCKDFLTYGDQCSERCNNNCVDKMCRQDGSCLIGCKQGFYGNNCSFQCGKHCFKNICSMDDQFKFICTNGCDRGYTQIDCEHECHDHCSICHQNGSCILCEEGYVLTADENTDSKAFMYCEVSVTVTESDKTENGIDINVTLVIVPFLLISLVLVIIIVYIWKGKYRTGFTHCLRRIGIFRWTAISQNGNEKPRLDNSQDEDDNPRLDNIQDEDDNPRLDNIQDEDDNPRLDNIQDEDDKPRLDNSQDEDDKPRLDNIDVKELRIILLGKTGAGKRETGNTLFMEDCFELKSKFGRQTVSSKHEVVWRQRFGKNLLVVNTAGLFDTQMAREEIKKVIQESIEHAVLGPHVFILVKSQGVEFSKDEMTVLETLNEFSGDNLFKYMIVVLTGSDQRKESVDEWIESCPDKQRKIFQDAGGGYMAISNGGTSEQRQQEALKLFRKIEMVVEQNGGGYLSSDFFKKECDK